MEQRLRFFLRIGLIKGYCVQNKTYTVIYPLGIRRKVVAQ